VVLLPAEVAFLSLKVFIVSTMSPISFNTALIVFLRSSIPFHKVLGLPRPSVLDGVNFCGFKLTLLHNNFSLATTVWSSFK
jgi:hypothetical protein